MKLIWIVIIIAVCVCALTVLACRMYVNKTFDKISRIIQSSLTGNTDQIRETDETRESKFAKQLRKILEQADYEIVKAKSEKDEIAALLSDLSHQLKTPLANLSMYIELLKDESLSVEERQEFVSKLSEQNSKMEWLTKMLIQISRLEVGIIEFEAVPADLKETLSESISLVYAGAVKKNIQIEVEDFADCKLLHSRKWTKEAFINILDNAIKYSEEDSKILIRVVPMELYTKIMIIDEGIGIPKEEYNQIFKRFYRGKQVREKEGTGLGLYLAQLILTKEGGYITVSSEVGKGSSFSVFLLNSRL
ncbi:sensor histidine kinase [Anaerocolumna sp. MB42-C2]|uniref:sensor histidine kinase n=1 Tax=Anaerocolumna sp. MB42-C2 TaxID=3070997 RepID=UPI0027E101E1|nr:HAMP domain-containing sensor histidine kinase [Anaerocolumna sp. MB42-C2]WMJ89984.1 HAMP domain-containing sensor histidine kinase [Anaerocolumna sp. MB42-C2]